MTPKKTNISARVIDTWNAQNENSGQEKPMLNMVPQDQMYLWLMRMPEIRGIISTLISDIWAEGYYLNGTDARVKKIKRFLRKNKFKLYCKSVMRDQFVTGNGYLGKAAITERQVENVANSVWKKLFKKRFDQISKIKLLNKIKKAKPDIYSPSVLFPLLSRSIKIKYDKHGVVQGYIQYPLTSSQNLVFENDDADNRVTGTMTMADSGGAIEFSPDEIIHFPLEPIGDQIYGTSPFQNAIIDIVSLWSAKNYGGAFFQNDATPSFIYKLEDEIPNSPNYNKFVEQIKSFKNNPHKSLVITGKLDIERVNPLNKDLEFSEFIDKFTQRILLSWGITDRFNHLFGKRVNQPAGVEGYYKIVSNIQSDWEDILNNNLFDELGVEFRFNRSYKRDESREADIVDKLAGRIISVNEAREYLGLKTLKDNELTNIFTEGSEMRSKEKQPKSEVGSADARSEQNIGDPTSAGVSDEEDK